MVAATSFGATTMSLALGGGIHVSAYATFGPKMAAVPPAVKV